MLVANKGQGLGVGGFGGVLSRCKQRAIREYGGGYLNLYIG